MQELIEKLKEFAGGEFRYKVQGNTLTVFGDTDYYVYNFDTNELFYVERGQTSKIGAWDNRIGPYFLGCHIQSQLGNGVNYISSEKLEKVKSVTELDRLISEYVSSDLYSIGTIVDRKISLIQEKDQYYIIYPEDENKYIIDTDTDKDFIFGRFFYEILSYEHAKNNIRRFEIIFGITFTKAEISSLLGCSDCKRYNS